MTTVPSPLAALSAEIATLAAAAAPGAVAITHKRHSASGFYWRPDVIATASESLPVRRGETVTIHAAGGVSGQGTVVGHDPSTDLALIRTPAAGVALPTAATTAMAIGQALLVVGRMPHGASATLGFVTLAAGPWRSMRGGNISQRIVVDARLPRAAEGAAVVDTAGGLLGMAVFGPRRRVLVIPVDTIERAGVELLAHGRIRQGYLGVSVQAVPMPEHGTDGKTERRLGLMVMGLDGKGPAAAAGILRGDIITAIDGAAPRTPRALAHLLPGDMIGQSKSVALVRAGQPTHISVTIGEAPEH